MKFSVPTVVNGKVYVGSAAEIDVYGLLNAAAQTKSPVISPGSESFSPSVSVTITDATAGAKIYYTTDGSTPTTSSAVYSAPISVTSTENGISPLWPPKPKRNFFGRDTCRYSPSGDCAR